MTRKHHRIIIDVTFNQAIDVSNATRFVVDVIYAQPAIKDCIGLYTPEGVPEPIREDAMG